MGLPENWMGFLIHCANCGKEIPLNKAWLEYQSKTKVCGKECHGEMLKKYCHELVRKK